MQEFIDVITARVLAAIEKTKGSATYVIAATDASDGLKNIADYACDGVDDDVQVQAALDALPSTGGTLQLVGSSFVFGATVSRLIDDVTIRGQGKTTQIDNDGAAFLFSVGRQSGWSFDKLSTDAGGIGLGFDEQADIRNCFKNGERIDNRKVAAVEYNNTVTSTSYQGTHDVAIQGDYAYCCCYQDDAFHVVDISDPENPSIAATLTDVGPARLDGIHDVVVDGQFAFVTCINRPSIVAIDISTPSAPAIVGELVDGTKLTAVHALSKRGDYIYAGGHSCNWFNVIDASTPASMSIIGSVSDATYLNYIRGTYPKGDYVYVMVRGSGYLTVIDVTTKAAPVIADSGNAHILIASTGGTDRSCNVRVKDGFAYCTTNAHDKLVVVDVRDVTNLAIVAELDIEDAYYITLAGNYAFVSRHQARYIYVVDITNPHAPYITYTFYASDQEFLSGMAIKDDYIYASPRDRADVCLVVSRLPAEPLEAKSKLIETTRDLAAAAGDVEYAGVGFTPKTIIAMAADTANVWANGFSDETRNNCCVYNAYGSRDHWPDTTYFLFLGPTSGHYQRCTVKDFTEDGFILTWARVGTPTGTINLMFLCSR